MLLEDVKKRPPQNDGRKKNKIKIKNWMGGVSIISGSLSGAQGAFPARQISLYYCRDRELLSSFFNLPDLQYASILDSLTSKSVAT